MNNFISKLKNISFVALALLSFTSCLKDKGFEAGTYGLAGFSGGEFVSIGLSGRNINSLSLESKSGEQSIDLFQTSYEYVDPASEDIKVTFAKDDAAVTAADATLTLLPAAALNLSAPNVTISKGKRVSGSFVLKINTSTLDPKKAYGLAFTIASTSKSSIAIPANLKTVIFRIALKNKYDGYYKVEGTMQDFVVAALGGLYPHNTNLYTAGPDAVDYGQPTYNFGASYPRGEIHLISNGGSVSGYGLFAPVFKFDANDNVIAVTNFWGQPSGNGRSARLDATGINKYDPATKTIKVKYWMVQGGDRTLFNETFTWVRAR